MSRLKAISLGVEALEYLREVLVEGRLLSGFLLRRPDLERGRTFTLLPEDADLRQLHDFRTGGKLPEPPPGTHLVGEGFRMVPKPNMDAALAEHIQEFLGGGLNRLCLLENWMADGADPWIASAASKLLLVESDVYHVLDTKDGNLGAIEVAIAEATTSIWPPIVGVLTYGALQQQRLRETAVVELSQFAAQAETVIVGAYDGEGYVIWKRPVAVPNAI